MSRRNRPRPESTPEELDAAIADSHESLRAVRGYMTGDDAAALEVHDWPEPGGWKALAAPHAVIRAQSDHIRGLQARLQSERVARSAAERAVERFVGGARAVVALAEEDVPEVAPEPSLFDEAPG